MKHTFVIAEAHLGHRQTYMVRFLAKIVTQLKFTCSKSTIEALKKGVKYVQKQ